MKQTLLALVLLLNFPCAATQMSVEDGQIFSEFYTYISQVPLPDGMSVFGNYAPGSRPFDFDHMNDNGAQTYTKAVTLSRLLSLSATEGRENRLQSMKECYDFLVSELYKLTPDAVTLFRQIIGEGSIYGTKLIIPEQRERAAIYGEISKWRLFKGPIPTDTLEAIRIKRDRLDAIAAEDAAKRKADADRRAAEQDTTQATLTSIAYKPTGESYGLRRRRLPHDQNGSNAGTEMDNHTPLSPLIVAH